MGWLCRGFNRATVAHPTLLYDKRLPTPCYGDHKPIHATLRKWDGFVNHRGRASPQGRYGVGKLNFVNQVKPLQERRPHGRRYVLYLGTCQVASHWIFAHGLQLLHLLYLRYYRTYLYVPTCLPT